MKPINLVLCVGAALVLAVGLPGCATPANEARAPATSEPPPAVVPGTGSETDPVLGVFRGTERPSEVDRFEGWLGRRVAYVLDYVGAAAPRAKDPWAGIDDPGDRCLRWGHHRQHLVLSVAILPNDRLTLRGGAAGDYDEHWLRFGRALVANGCADAVLRLGWEFNGRFYPWAAGGHEHDFAAYWRRIVANLRRVEGQEFTYEWSVLAGNANADAEAAYPGDEVVDFIGLDAYDTSRFSDPEDRWQDQLERTYGLRWHAQFAADHDKPLSFSEWGVVVRPGDDLGGGDAPLYIERMIDWIRAHDVAHAIYFDVDAGDAAHRISTSRFPKASAAFRRLAVVLAGAPVPPSAAADGSSRAP